MNFLLLLEQNNITLDESRMAEVNYYFNLWGDTMKQNRKCGQSYDFAAYTNLDEKTVMSKKKHTTEYETRPTRSTPVCKERLIDSGKVKLSPVDMIQNKIECLGLLDGSGFTPLLI